MEYVIMICLVVLALFIYFLREAGIKRKKWKQFEESLYSDYGKDSTKVYPQGRMDKLKGQGQRIFKGNENSYYIDDITWADLSMDAVFQKADYTLSSAGEEMLYRMLRNPSLDLDVLSKRNEDIEYFQTHDKDRVFFQKYFAKVGKTGKYCAYEYLQQLYNLGKRSNVRHFIVLGLILLSIVLCFFRSQFGFSMLCICLVFNLFTYFREKRENEPYLTTFAYFLRILKSIELLKKVDIPLFNERLELLQTKKNKMTSLKWFEKIVMNAGGMSSDIFDVLIDYLNILLHIDLIGFNFMLDKLIKQTEDLSDILDNLGYIEAVISIGAFRQNLGTYCIPELRYSNSIIGETGNKDNLDSCFEAINMFHPLLENPVENSVSLTKGMLLTGSNASGKSTFLKTIAVSQILAQSFFTTPCQNYKAPVSCVYTSMALKDNIFSGESYFIVEIRSIKRLLEIQNKLSMQNKKNNASLMCFIDEVLRGTNTVERISASCEILKSLSGAHTLCFAATHDIELTQLLKDEYEQYHFEEKICDNDVQFNYHLLKGSASTRNAISLLRVMGYDQKIVDQAEKRANYFLREGEWQP